jgi:hypothetical protein
MPSIQKGIARVSVDLLEQLFMPRLLPAHRRVDARPVAPSHLRFSELVVVRLRTPRQRVAVVPQPLPIVESPQARAARRDPGPQLGCAQHHVDGAIEVHVEGFDGGLFVLRRDQLAVECGAQVREIEPTEHAVPVGIVALRAPKVIASFAPGGVAVLPPVL